MILNKKLELIKILEEKNLLRRNVLFHVSIGLYVQLLGIYIIRLWMNLKIKGK